MSGTATGRTGRTGPAAPTYGSTDERSGADWRDVCARAWDREPARVSHVVPPIDVVTAFRTATAMSGPFRAGARPRSVSAVRFFTVDGRLAAPGALLPTEDDYDLDRYADRLDDELDGKGWLLTIRHPFVLDFPRWARARDALAGLWSRIGWPALPLTSELCFGHGFCTPPPAPGTDVLTWVLAGTHRLDAGAGDVLYQPAAAVEPDGGEEFTARAAVLRITVPTDPTTALPAVRGVLQDLVRRDPVAAQPMPYLPYPPPENADGSTPPIAEFAEVAQVLGRVAGDPDGELTRTVRRRWAARRTAAGLEPVPEPRSATAPGPGTEPAIDARSRFRLAAEVLRVPEGPSAEVWAVNGLLLPVRGALAPRVLAALDRRRTSDLAEVCADVGVTGHTTREEGVLTLLRVLYRVRAIESAADADTTETTESTAGERP
ncbi:hypothetical protein [Embleya sp. NPDC020630]|uniref:hypothetical protein n=1 Tax=Embleya sp. NPDC020630 TaxID=3363979 RepID=UPI0037BA61A1